MSKIRNNRLNTCCGHDGIRLVDKYINTSFDIVYAVYENLDELKSIVYLSEEEIRERVESIVNAIEESAKNIKPLIDDIDKGTYLNGQRQLIIDMSELKEGINYIVEIKDPFRKETYKFDLTTKDAITFSVILQKKLDELYPGGGLVILEQHCTSDPTKIIVIDNTDKTYEKLTLSEINFVYKNNVINFNWNKSTSTIINILSRMDEFHRLMDTLDALIVDEAFEAIYGLYKSLDDVFKVYENIEDIKKAVKASEHLLFLDNLFLTNNFVVVVNSVEELEKLNTTYFTMGRIKKELANGIAFSDFIYDKKSKKWIEVDTKSNLDKYHTTSYVYNEGKAFGGETVIKFPVTVEYITAVYLNGIRYIPGNLGYLSFKDNSFILTKKLKKDDEVVFVFVDPESNSEYHLYLLSVSTTNRYLEGLNTAQNVNREIDLKELDLNLLSINSNINELITNNATYTSLIERYKKDNDLSEISVNSHIIGLIAENVALRYIVDKVNKEFDLLSSLNNSLLRVVKEDLAAISQTVRFLNKK